MKRPYKKPAERPFLVKWSADDDETLRRLWKEGKTYREISVEIGRTRNSVSGRIHRLQLEDKETFTITPSDRAARLARRWAHERPPPKAYVRKKVVPRKPRDYANEAPVKAAPGREPSTKRVGPSWVEALPPGFEMPDEPVYLWQAEPGRCRYPVEGTRFEMKVCHRPTVGGTSWCGHCIGLVYDHAATATSAVTKRPWR